MNEMEYDAESGSEYSEDESFDPSENQDILTDDDRRRIQGSAENIPVLEAKLATVNTKIAALKKRLSDIQNANPLLFPKRSHAEWRTQYDSICARRDAHLKSSAEHKKAAGLIEAEIAEKKAEVAKKAKLRGREPNYDIPTITWLMERLAKVKSEKVITADITDSENSFRISCDTDDSYLYTYKHTVGVYETNITNKLAPLTMKTRDLKQCIDEDKWLGKYLVYARRHGLPTSDDRIFDACNRHFMDRHAENYEFDCPCYADPTSEDELEAKYGESRDYYPHVWSGGRCNRGTKMYLEMDTLPIGFIECKDPLNYCHPSRN